MKNRIIICGYPKSGNTWLTRLTAEILNCPVAGFWCEPFNKEESIEGENRSSTYQCFKAHHNKEQLEHTLALYGNGTEKVIYIYRDPRAVVVSGTHYFKYKVKYPRLYSFMCSLPLGRKVYNRIWHQRSYKMREMTRGIVEGTKHGSWMKYPWKDHILDYQQRPNTLVLSYESMRQDPLSAAQSICDFLGEPRSDAELKQAIDNQSFDAKKRQFEKQGRHKNAQFMRKGSANAWTTELAPKHRKYLEDNLGDFMAELGYKTD
ncbi:hypothetical protein GCM10011369_32140 [Neiella marina]|uniref:Sulfotransferase domain-containing protein n=1 Tax=Neiella marina TaxID=508461 RepID=A0A8J2U9D7_9GAMM|nr:sulfotransferase domain-containing protein [Neiella marina]GGA87628.1 hypothetical protein GCM10011369_32140 [Neiella marina]